MTDLGYTPSDKAEDVGRPLTKEEWQAAVSRSERGVVPGLNSHSYTSKRAMMFRSSKGRFIEWLEDAGAEVEEVASKWEVLRYRARSAGTSRSSEGKVRTHIVFTNKDGRLTFQGDSSWHFSLFVSGQPFPVLMTKGEAHRSRVKERKTRATWTSKMRKALKERDGCDCWFCHKPLGDDITIEHMLAQRLGGTDHIDNLVLAHGECNRKAGHKTPDEKEAIREFYRKGLHTKVSHWVDPPTRRARKKTT